MKQKVCILNFNQDFDQHSQNTSIKSWTYHTIYRFSVTNKVFVTLPAFAFNDLGCRSPWIAISKISAKKFLDFNGEKCVRNAHLHSLHELKPNISHLVTMITVKRALCLRSLQMDRWSLVHNPSLLFAKLARCDRRSVKPKMLRPSKKKKNWFYFSFWINERKL